MDFDINKSLDSVQEGTREVAEIAHKKAYEFHSHFVSKTIPKGGKFGNVAKFSAELIPGVSEYNAIREGNWKEFAIAAGVDVVAIGAGVFTGGAGTVAVKGGAAGAKLGVKKAVKEIAEVGAKKALKETAETGAKKTIGAETERAVKKAVETGSEKVVKETTEKGVEKASKEVAETGAEKIKRVAREVGDKIDKTRFPEYMDEVEKITNREIPRRQKELLEKAMKEKDFAKLPSEKTKLAKNEFNNKKKDLILEWEKNTGEKWPRYEKDVIDDAGNVIKRAGDRYDAHHIIEKSTGGPNEWWNLHPATAIEHKEIHRANGIAKQIFE